jgi:PAS domain S-box-containing protein
MLDPKGHVVSWNTGAQQLKGYRAEEIIGQHFSRFYPPEDARAGVPQFGLARAREVGRFEAEGWRIRQNGTRFWANVVITPVLNPSGELMGFAKVTRDLTERRRAEEKLRQSESRLAEAQHIARLGSWYWDLSSDVVSWSDELYQIYGLNPETFSGTYEAFLDQVHPDDQDPLRQLMTRALESNQPFAFDHRIIRPDGAVLTLHARGEAILDEAGRVVALSGTGQDITERKATEDQLRASRAQLMQEVGARQQVQQQLERWREAERTRIAREVHDELGGALTALKMGLHRIRRIEELPAAAQEMLTDLAGEIDSSAHLVRRIAHELRPAVLDDFGLLAALEWQLSEFQKRSGLTTEWRCAIDDLPLSNEAAIACFRIVQEALTNVARHAQASRVTVTLERDGEHVLLQVTDDGRGLPADRASTTSHLGLVGMRERADLLAAKLDIASAPGQGTTVTLRVPVGSA